MTNKKGFIFFLTMMLIAFFCFGGIISGISNLFFVANIILTVAVILHCKFSMLSIISFISTYLTFPVFIQTNYGHSYGILEMNSVYIQEEKFYLYMLLFQSIIYAFSVFSDLLHNEKKIYKLNVRVSNTLLYFACLGAVLFTIVAFPRIPFVDYAGDRFGMLLPGHAWNHFALLCLIILSFRYKDSWIARITGLFVLSWFVLNGERVDMLGYLVGMCLFYFNNHKLTWKKIAVLSVVGTMGIIVFLSMGSLRSQGQINIIDSIKNILVQSTASDVAYVFNSAINHVSDYGLMNGKTYISYLYNAVPLFESPYQCQDILTNKYGAPGGEFLLCEPLMNFGAIGIVLVTCFELFLINKLLKSRRVYFKYVSIFIFFTLFRIAWYGRIYIETAILYFIPFSIIIIYYIQGSYFKKKFSEINQLVSFDDELKKEGKHGKIDNDSCAYI